MWNTVSEHFLLVLQQRALRLLGQLELLALVLAADRWLSPILLLNNEEIAGACCRIRFA